MLSSFIRLNHFSGGLQFCFHAILVHRFFILNFSMVTVVFVTWNSLQVVTIFFFKFSSVMAGLAEGSQFDARQFDARMNDL